jgi:hypothetical protein
MKVLTVRQPWAWLIINGYKRIEYRSWQPGKRLKPGERIAIHAGLTLRPDDLDDASLNYPVSIPVDLERGAIIGTVVFKRAVEPNKGRGWEWHLAKPKPCKPVKCKGKLGIWHVP